MDLKWFGRNLKSAWHHSQSTFDFIKQLHWHYSHRILSPRSFEIGFQYPEPVGRCRLIVRANKGSDVFVQGEVFEHQYYRLPLAHAPQSILDLGANAGFTAVYFSRIYPRAQIACVEPIESNLAVLRGNLKLNNVNATVFSSAVALSDGVAQMELQEKDCEHRVVESADVEPAGKRVQVRTQCIPTILRELGWERIGLLKVDIEGYEKTLFSGACEWVNLVDNMCIECHEGFSETDLKRIASDFGFSKPRRLEGTWLLERD
jgi:FkbM family methyltransferase